MENQNPKTLENILGSFKDEIEEYVQQCLAQASSESVVTDSGEQADKIIAGEDPVIEFATEETAEETVEEAVTDEKSVAEEEKGSADEPIAEEVVAEEKLAKNEQQEALLAQMQGIGEVCSSILKGLKKEETQNMQVNLLQRRCLQYEEDIVKPINDVVLIIDYGIFRAKNIVGNVSVRT